MKMKLTFPKGEVIRLVRNENNEPVALEIDGKIIPIVLEGADGFSPVISVTKNDGVATITILDVNGTQTFTLQDGIDGSMNYEEMYNRPRINNILLEGNKTSSDLGLVANYSNLTDKPSINNVTLSGNKTSADLSLASANHNHTQSQITDLGNNDITLLNNKGIKAIDTNNVANDLIKLNGLNQLKIGEGLQTKSYLTSIYGSPVNLINNTNGMVSFENGTDNYDGHLTSNTNNITLGRIGKLWYRLYCRNSVYVSSDERAKKYINDLDNKYEDLFHKLNPKRFKFKKDGIDDRNWHLGFIAQEVEQTINEVDLSKLALIEHSFFEEDGEQKDRYVLAYEEFIALNTHMLQKAYAKIDELESRINNLEKLVNG